ncbi:MAG: hypothetical protein H6R02_887 [Burkholderiaceae bacterium]|jgi:hypothetical protein|nr:hypothetical protein [Burkholderiaceae bacterium]
MHAITSDFRVDLSLHVLSLSVGGAIALALIWHLVILLSPLIEFRAAQIPAVADFQVTEAGPPAWAAMEVVPEPPLELSAAPLPAATHDMVFRCESGGRVTYTDRPCERGDMRVLRLRRN